MRANDKQPERSLLSGDLKSSVFIRLALARLLLMIAMSAFMIHSVPALKQIGLTAVEPAGAFAFAGIGSIVVH